MKIKENKNKVLLFLLTLFLISGSFFWFEYRPTKIKHDCSWIKKNKDAIPEKPAQNKFEIPEATYKQLIENSIIKKCNNWGNSKGGDFNSIVDYFKQDEECENENNRVIKNLRIMKPAEPAKEWWIKATKEEYQFCLHDKGL